MFPVSCHLFFLGDTASGQVLGIDMDRQQQKIAKLEAQANKDFTAGMKSFEAGFPSPPLDTPGCYGWEAAEKIRSIRSSYLKDMYEALQEEREAILNSEYEED